MYGAPINAACRLPGAVLDLRTARALLVTLLCVVVRQGALGQSKLPVEAILRKSVASQRGVNLRGIQTDVTPSEQGMDTVTRRMIQRADGKSLAVAVDTSGKTGSVYQDDGSWTRTYDPATKTCTISRSPSHLIDDRSIDRAVRRILSNYKVKLHGMETFAGRRCYNLSMDPRDPHSHPLDVKIDAQTGTTLSRTEFQKRGGSTVSLTFFTSITFPDSIPDKDVTYKFPRGTKHEKTALSEVFRTVRPLRGSAGFEICLPASMPAGYQFESCELVRLQDAPTACIRYSDGLAALTVFETQVKGSLRLVDGVVARSLPRGEAIAVCQIGRTSCTVMGPRSVQGIMIIARALDTDEARAKMSLISQTYRVPIDAVVEYRNQGLCLDDMAALLEIGRQTHRDLASLVAMHRDGWPWDSIARRLKANVRRISDAIRKYQCR